MAVSVARSGAFFLLCPPPLKCLRAGMIDKFWGSVHVLLYSQCHESGMSKLQVRRIFSKVALFGLLVKSNYVLPSRNGRKILSFTEKSSPATG